jgi:hypothetical protein
MNFPDLLAFQIKVLYFSKAMNLFISMEEDYYKEVNQKRSNPLDFCDIVETNHFIFTSSLP